jgi:cytochrome c-type biogenesis protein CcmF
LKQNDKVAASLFPRIQLNPGMGGILPSPDISRGLTRDLYTHVSAPMNREAEPDWSKLEEIRVRMGQEFFVNDYVAVLESVQRINNIPGIPLGPEDVAVQAKIKVEGEHTAYYAEPVFLIKDKSEVGRIAFEIGELGVKLALLNIHPDTNEFTMGVNTRQKDWVIIKALEKPYINVLWLGTGILMIGFCVAMVRRFREDSI